MDRDHETYSEESSDALSTPSCRSLEGDPEMIVRGINETPALQELEETVMQARAAEDYKQARKLKARRGSLTVVSSDNSDGQVVEPTMSSSIFQNRIRSRINTWDVAGAERDLDSEKETLKRTKSYVKGSPEFTRGSHGSTESDDSSFGTLESRDSSKLVKDRESFKKASTTENKTPKKQDKK